MRNRLGQFGLKRPVLLFEFRKVHWHRHTMGLHKSIFPSRMEFCHDSPDKSMAVLLCGATNSPLRTVCRGLWLAAVNARRLIRRHEPG
jgi:hypothetical protein